MNRQRLVVTTLALAVLASGCARTPATTSTAAPAPTSAAATSRMTGPAPNQVAGGAGGTTPVSNPGGAAKPTPARPAPTEFVAIAELRDVHFDFDKYEIRSADAQILDRNAAWLKANASDLLLIEGHSDARGTNEYNLALGERRAKATMNYLVSQGVAARRITLISYGEERAQCTEQTEACWARNRRAHFLVKRR